MAKLILISGGNGSGKSRWAEKLLSGFPGERFYIATMVPQTADNLVRIEKHRAQRAGLGFVTVEAPGKIGEAPVTPGSAVLLEDVSNLLGNAMFATGGTAAEVFEDIQALLQRCALLAAVTISGLSVEGYTGETARYIAALNRLNGQLFSAADAAVQMKDRVAHAVKGDADALIQAAFRGVFNL